MFHDEPHIAGDRVRQGELDRFLAAMAGRALKGGKDAITPDYVADSTVSARAMRTAVLATASLVLRSRLGRPAQAGVAAAAAGLESFSRKSLDELVAEGAVARRRVTSEEVAAALEKAGARDAKLDWPVGQNDDLYIEFITALATPTAIGGNLIGVVPLEEYKNQLPKGAEAIYIASTGPYDFFGTKYFQASEGNRFDRFRLIQNGKTFRFTQADYTYAVPVAGEQLAGLFLLPANSGFNPQRPWRLEILVNGASTKPVTVAFGLDYKLPDLSAVAAGARFGRRLPATRSRLGRSLARRTGESRYPRRASHGAHADIRLPGEARPPSLGAPRSAIRVSARRSRLARLDCRRAALDRQCH